MKQKKLVIAKEGERSHSKSGGSTIRPLAVLLYTSISRHVSISV